MDRATFRTHLNFEVLAKFFFDLAEERYPSSQKIRQMANKLTDPISQDSLESIYLKIGLLNSMRDMIKEVAPNQLYRSLQHRDDLYMAIIETLEDLEDELEELEEQAAEDEEETD